MPTFYVSKSGNDGNSGDSEVLAKLTIGSAISAASAGDTISIGDGVWAGADMQSGATGYIILSKTLTFLLSPGASSASLDPSVTTAGIRINAGDVGITIGEGINIGNSVVTPDHGLYVLAGAGVTNIAFNGSISAANFYAINISPTAGVVHFTSDGMQVAGKRSGIYAPALKAGSTVNLISPVVTCADKVAAYGAIYIRASESGCTCSVENPVVVVSHASAMAAQTDKAIAIVNIDNALILDAVVSATTSAATNGAIVGANIDCDDPALTAHNGRIIGGVYNLDANGGIGVVIGHDVSSGGNYLCNFGIIRGVTINGGDKFKAYTGHGIMLSFTEDSFACANVANNLGIGVLLKRATRCRFNVNKVSRAQSSYMQFKGCTDSVQDGNELFFSPDDTGHGVYGNPDGATNNVGCTFAGNTFVVRGEGTDSLLAYILSSQDVTGNKNLFSIADGAALPATCAIRQAISYTEISAYVSAEEPTSGVTTSPQAPKIGSAGSRQTYSPAPGVQLAL